jgi:hypothetical protein
MTIRIVEETFEIKNVKVSVSVLDLKNALIILVTDQRNEYRIGSMALATRIPEIVGETVPSVVTLLGTYGELLAKIVARKAALNTGRISLSIVGLKETDNETASSIIKALEKILDKTMDEPLSQKAEELN